MKRSRSSTGKDWEDKGMISPDGRFAGTIKCGDKELVFGKKTFVMGILNVTPDSFSDGGMYDTPEKALEHAKEMVEQGADIIDVGGESTRPGYTPVTTDVEKERVIPAIELIRRELDVIISVDTTKSDVAEAAVKAGANIINDVSGLKADPKMAKTAADSGAAVVLMYNRRFIDKGATDFRADDLTEGINYVRESIRLANDSGISDDRIITDPGIGFGTSRLQDLALTSGIMQFGMGGKYPVLYGGSRKRVVRMFSSEGVDGKYIDNVSIGLACTAVSSGASIVRVHDVKNTRQQLDGCDMTIYAYNIFAGQ